MNGTVYVGPSIWTILGIIFVVLKLVGVINWSWVWVLSPFWIPIVGFIFIVVLVTAFYFAWKVVNKE